MKCKACGNDYKKLSSHLSRSDCDYPEISKTQEDILTGLIMGDGCVVSREDRNPYIVANMICKDYLNWLDDNFTFYGRGVSMKRSSDKQFDLFGGNRDNWNDLYVWRTRASPKFEKFSEWYETGEKVFPESVSLSPMVLKNWYCCDGSLHRHNYMSISAVNERENKDKILKMFDNIGFPIDRIQENGNHFDLVYNVDSTKSVMEYMGNPLPGFEYKWVEK